MQVIKTVCTTMLCLASMNVLASPACTSPKEKWIPQETFKENLVKQGYQIKKFKVTKKNCYEIYGHNKEGKKVEIYFEPSTGAVLKEELY